MTGSLQKKKGMYYVVINMTDKDGNRKPKWIKTGLRVEDTSNQKANRELRKVLNEYEQKNVLFSPEILVKDAAQNWLKDKSYEVDPVTLEGYRSYCKNHIIPYFTKKKLTIAKTTPQHIKDYYRDKLNEGLSPNSIRRHRVVLNGMFNDALEAGIIAYNPVSRVKPPKSQKFTGGFYSVEQINQLLKVAKGDALEVVILLAVFYGLRRSEILGLQWNAINFESDTIEIKRTVVSMMKTYEKEKTKTQKSNRTMPLFPELKEYLKQLKAQQIRQQLSCGAAFDNDYVCKWPDGRLYTPNFVSTHFAKLIEKNNLPKIRFHDLRHSCASLLISLGNHPSDVMDWLGHESITTTYNIYGHLMFEDKVRAGKSISGAIDLNALSV